MTWIIRISKLDTDKIQFSLNFENPRFFFKHFTIKIGEGSEAPCKPYIIYIYIITNPIKKHLILMTLLVGGKRCLIHFNSSWSCFVQVVKMNLLLRKRRPIPSKVDLKLNCLR